jgi:hypothetical protein
MTVATMNTTTTPNLAARRVHPARQDGHDHPRRIHTYEKRTLPARRVERSQSFINGASSSHMHPYDIALRVLIRHANLILSCIISFHLLLSFLGSADDRPSLPTLRIRRPSVQQR